MSSSNNLRENLNNYLSRNEKNSIASDLKSKIFNLKSSILPGNVYSSVPLDENSHGNEWSELSVNDCCPKLSRIQRQFIPNFKFFFFMGTIQPCKTPV
ncbi:hypothetical protein Phum_PHUM257270 [Pediculus humanus corporis]|uniref:Uncharacterized protein n=1 Tax=Pediculus humanus subsp. corporis TaxID=121224 RepID=E0VK63_PEDHC|nr:uncharacterized protein Phum_PHUM257270 [Pediculus humanus corporis]EEB13769.1 hypothetical protein Phum_PHUM257270 [Pediculus humanus corporis]